MSPGFSVPCLIVPTTGKELERGDLGGRSPRILLAFFLVLVVCKSGRRIPMILSAVQTVYCSQFLSSFSAASRQTMMDDLRTYLKTVL